MYTRKGKKIVSGGYKKDFDPLYDELWKESMFCYPQTIWLSEFYKSYVEKSKKKMLHCTKLVLHFGTHNRLELFLENFITIMPLKHFCMLKELIFEIHHSDC